MISTRWHVAEVAGVCAFSLLFTACSSTPLSEPDAFTATSTVTEYMTPAPIATHMAAGTRSEGWTLVGMSADGRRLFITYPLGDPCSESAGVIVEESTKAVTLTATTRVVRGGGNCESSLITADGYVDLSKPLGTRALLHASTLRTQDGS